MDTKEYFEICFESALEDIAQEKDLDIQEAELLLEKILDENPHFLDGYLGGYD